jgi:hypothetical protein
MPFIYCVPLLPLVAALLLVQRGRLLLLRSSAVLLLQCRRQLLGRGRRTLCAANAGVATALLLWTLMDLLGLAGRQACCWLGWPRCLGRLRRYPAGSGGGRRGLHAPNLELRPEEIRMHPARLLI